jgi:hypothetical protein
VCDLPDNEALVDHVKTLEDTIEVMPVLSELGPLINDAGEAFRRHAIILLTLIGEHARRLEDELAGLTAQLRACRMGDAS